MRRSTRSTATGSNGSRRWPTFTTCILRRFRARFGPRCSRCAGPYGSSIRSSWSPSISMTRCGAAIAAEDDIREDPVEGWPLGVIEALQFLKKRGVLLAIVSRNDEARIVQVWDSIMPGRLRLDDFAIRKINWRPKVENLEDIIREVNILPRGVVFIDDNPVERAGVKAALPEVRVLGAHPYLIRRILLWAPEMQVGVVTEESARRTEMVQAPGLFNAVDSV